MVVQSWLSSYHEKSEKKLFKGFLMIFFEIKAFLKGVNRVPDLDPDQYTQVLFPSRYGSTMLSPTLIFIFFYWNISAKPEPVMFFKMSLESNSPSRRHSTLLFTVQA